MLVRLITTAAVFGLGYYLGREIGRTESIREELERSRTPPPPEPPADKSDDPVT